MARHRCVRGLRRLERPHCPPDWLPEFRTGARLHGATSRAPASGTVPEDLLPGDSLGVLRRWRWGGGAEPEGALLLG